MPAPVTTFGKGLNSTRVRMSLIFALLAGFAMVLTALPEWFGQDISQTHLKLGLSSASLFFCALLMHKISQNLTTPIRQLTESARQIAAGNLDVDISVDCACDIGGLADSMRTMVRRLRESTAENIELANFDPVTSVANRHVLVRNLDAHIAGPHRPAGSVFLIDVIELRGMFDRYGHECGDEVMREIGRRLLSVLPMGDVAANHVNASKPAGAGGPVLARVSIKEFALHMPGLASPAQAKRLAEAMHATLADSIEFQAHRLALTVAIGIACYPQHAGTGSVVLQCAALARSEALTNPAVKGTCVFEQPLLDTVLSNEVVERELRAAIDEAQLEVYYQPKVSARDWSLVGVEALVRWNHPTRGVVGPVDFIPMAERTGMIIGLGMFVLEQSISQCAAWARTGRAIEVSINVSLEQFQRPEFSGQVIELVKAHKCPPQLITIEITETIANTNITMVSGQIDPMRELGIRFAIDDFGTGYSNLAQLTSLKFDILKVDRSFVSGLETEGAGKEVSRSIIQLGKNLGCRVVAEGAETIGQVSAASALGCDEIQGFYFARPMTLGAFEHWQGKRTDADFLKLVDTAFGTDFATRHEANPGNAIEALAS